MGVESRRRGENHRCDPQWKSIEALVMEPLGYGVGRHRHPWQHLRLFSCHCYQPLYGFSTLRLRRRGQPQCHCGSIMAEPRPIRKYHPPSASNALADSRLSCHCTGQLSRLPTVNGLSWVRASSNRGLTIPIWLGSKLERTKLPLSPSQGLGSFG